MCSNLRHAGILMFCIIHLTMARAEEPGRQSPQPITPQERQRCMENLRGALKSEEFWPSKHAAEALTQAGAGGEVIAAFGDLLPVEKDDQHRVGFVRELVRAGHRDLLPILFGILGDAKSNGRAHAAESLFKLGEIGDGRQLRAAIEQKENVSLQIFAAAALAKAGQADALALVRASLQADNRAARNLAAFALSRVGGEVDIKPLLAALDREQDEPARAFIIGALAALGNPKGREELGRALNSADATARAMAADFVGRSRAIEHQEKLVRLLDDPVLDVRVRAAQSLLTLSPPAAKR